ncbi:MAG: hypothetical protein CL521_00300 [Actinobacteria bacterium]|nr:hypothetical protein [Actinomycetota bacterium]|tara:strand:- start:600 stop:1370 length:771 start_codon:yes stop_codon:yes gene_type:complete
MCVFFLVSSELYSKVNLDDPINFHVDTIRYSYSGNFKALISVPIPIKTHPQPDKYPVIIYNYDEYYDMLGPKASLKRGYDILAFMRKFNEWGYACIVPMDRFRKVHAINGALDYVMSDPRFDHDQVHMIGHSEGAFLGLFTIKEFPNIRSMILLAPNNLYSSGRVSLSNLLREHKQIDVPMLMLGASKSKGYRRQNEKIVYRVLKQLQPDLAYLGYGVNPRWYFNTKHLFMKEVNDFLYRNSGPRKDNSDENSKSY